MRKYKVFIDENMPPQLARGLNELQMPQNKKDGFEIEVLAIKDVYGQGESDEDWIPKVGKENGIVITQDFRIQTQRHQKELYIENGVGILFFSPPSNSGFTYWELVRQLVNRWDEVKQIVRKNKPPFAYRCTSKTKFERLN
jgi:hypothetical protein